jgi:hypothetical protein
VKRVVHGRRLRRSVEEPREDRSCLVGSMIFEIQAEKSANDKKIFYYDNEKTS